LVWDALERISASASRLDRFGNCGSGCYVQYSATAEAVRLTASFCRDRLCQPCGRARSRLIADNLCRHCIGKTVRFATFTLKHNVTPLKDQIRRLYAAFVALRRRRVWRQHVAGGCAVLEVKIGQDDRWHVHLHTLIEGTFIEQRLLSSEWHAVTGDSYIVDVRRLSGTDKEIRYVASYCGKPLDATLFSRPVQTDEFARAIRGTRIISTFGTWRGLDVDALDPSAPTDWQSVGSLRELLADAKRGDPWAVSLLGLLASRTQEISLCPADTS